MFLDRFLLKINLTFGDSFICNRFAAVQSSVYCCQLAPGTNGSKAATGGGQQRRPRIRADQPVNPHRSHPTGKNCK